MRYTFFYPEIIDSGSDLVLGALVVIGIGGLFSWVGLTFWLRMKGSCIFDKSTGRYSQNIGEYAICRLDEICVLQLTQNLV